MKIIIGGGTGLVGQALVPELIKSGYEIYIIGRDKEKIKKIFKNKVHANTWDGLPALNPATFDAIINLTGENIAAHRWSSKVKNKLLSSRIKATQKFVDWAAKVKLKKPHLYNASAIGIYGLQHKVPSEQEAYTENSVIPPAMQNSFSSQLVHQWEQTALQGKEANIPVTLMRFGVVLKSGDGLLKKLELPTQYSLSAVIGNGEQPVAWIDHADLIKGICFLLDHPEIIGPVNLVAPELVSQKYFNKTMAQIFGKPTFLRLPSWFVHCAFGQMGDELLLAGQAVIPQRLTEAEFQFQYPTLLSALSHEYEKTASQH
ncbi:MAG: TIGR01777 family oxidoreductase [Legionella sp.]|uniref:TIGR01777 family oxidoreductase n=1 Tax=Legionella sp. TaxID=459 RepID=UPI0039E71AA0